jgi:predicted metal-dependent HD superfamily phosphohydrolase
MSLSTEILRKASSYVYNLYHDAPNGTTLYHNYNHTVEVAAHTMEIAEGMKLSTPEMETVLLAAWFHDTGYLQSPQDHERRSAEIAVTFLKNQHYPEEKIENVVGCILATKVPQQPKNLLEQIVCDADLLHLGKKECLRKGEMLRMELEAFNGEQISQRDWLKRSIDFLKHHHFHTAYALQEYNERREDNLTKMKKKLKKLEHKNGNDVSPKKLLKEKLPGRGIETMFRIASHNHMELSSIADKKASIMISVPSIIISIVTSVLLRRINETPELLIPTFMLIVTCSASIVFAILSTRPKVTSGKYSRDEIAEKKINLLFFGNFYGMKFDDYEWGMKELMKDKELLYGILIKDIYYLGQVLGRKYNYLRISYNIFLYGLVASVMAFIYAFWRYGVEL